MIEGTKLRVIKTLYRKTSRNENRVEESTTTSIYELQDIKTGQTGLFRHSFVQDKRDVDEQTFHTDSPELFLNNHPEVDIIWNLLGKDVQGQDEILEHELDYMDGPDGWGLYLLK